MNYIDLRDQIQDELENTETVFVSNIDRFIRIVEERIFEELELNVFQKTATATFTAGTRFLTLPDDYLNIISVAVEVDGDYRYLLKKHPSFMNDYSIDPDDATLRDVPKYYADHDARLQTSTSAGSTLVVSPNPDLAYTVELNYYFRPESITDHNFFRSVTLGSNPLTTGSAGSNVITVADTSHGADNASTVTLASASATDGISADAINTTHEINEVSSNAYKITVNSTSTSTITGASSGSTAGGGSSVTAIYMKGGNSWIGTYAESALLYGCLAEGYSFMRGETGQLQYYEQRYQAEVARIRVRYSGRGRQDEHRHGNLMVEVQ